MFEKRKQGKALKRVLKRGCDFTDVVNSLCGKSWDSYLALEKVLMQLIITDPTWATEVMTKSTGTTDFYQDLYELYVEIKSAR